ncbi:hypothetical protein OROGR_022034 [Orobanche gracilis]
MLAKVIRVSPLWRRLLSPFSANYNLRSPKILLVRASSGYMEHRESLMSNTLNSLGLRLDDIAKNVEIEGRISEDMKELRGIIEDLRVRIVTPTKTKEIKDVRLGYSFPDIVCDLILTDSRFGPGQVVGGFGYIHHEGEQGSSICFAPQDFRSGLTAIAATIHKLVNIVVLKGKRAPSPPPLLNIPRFSLSRPDSSSHHHQVAPSHIDVDNSLDVADYYGSLHQLLLHPSQMVVDNSLNVADYYGSLQQLPLNLETPPVGSSQLRLDFGPPFVGSSQQLPPHMDAGPSNRTFDPQCGRNNASISSHPDGDDEDARRRRLNPEN